MHRFPLTTLRHLLTIRNDQELGFEGVDKFADKYHDKVYDRLPAIPVGTRKQNRQEQAQTRKDRQHNQWPDQQNPQTEKDQRAISNSHTNHNHQQYSSHPDKRYLPNRPRSSGKENGFRDDMSMSSYAPDRRTEWDYRGGGDERYYEDERIHYKGPDTATTVPRGRDASNNTRGQQMTVSSRC